jgi:hypothetical protein
MRWAGLSSSQLALAGFRLIDGENGLVELVSPEAVQGGLDPLRQREILEQLGGFSRDWALVQQGFLPLWQARFFPQGFRYLMTQFPSKIPGPKSADWVWMNHHLPPHCRLSLALFLDQALEGGTESEYLGHFLLLKPEEQQKALARITPDFYNRFKSPELFWKHILASAYIRSAQEPWLSRQLDPSLFQDLVKAYPKFLTPVTWPYLPPAFYPQSVQALEVSQREDWSLHAEFWRSFTPRQLKEEDFGYLQEVLAHWPELLNLAHLSLMPQRVFSQSLAYAQAKGQKAIDNRGRLWSYLRNKYSLDSPELAVTLEWIRQNPQFIEPTYLTMDHWYSKPTIAQQIIRLMYFVRDEDFLPFLHKISHPELQGAIIDYQDYLKNAQGQISLSQSGQGSLSPDGGQPSD